MVVFDKTGTLTHGQLEIIDCIDLVKKFKVPLSTDQNQLDQQSLYRLAQSSEQAS